MGTASPGHFEIMDEAARLCAFRAGADVLDMGCGDGATLLYLREKYGVRGTGIDLSPAWAPGDAGSVGVELLRGDMTAPDFPSYSFDVVIMECSLSLVSAQEETLHEAYCLLRPGGHLVVADLRHLNPDPEAAARARREAAAFRSRPHAEGDCGRNESAPPEYGMDGALVTESLLPACEQLGFEVVCFSDFSARLRDFAAERIFAEGAAAFGDIPPDFAKKIGYFLLVLKKLAREART